MRFVGQIATALADAYVIDPIVDWLAESPSNSFVAGTGVVTGEDEDGNLITTNIEDLEIGDLVLARDEFDPNAPNRYSIVTAVSHRTVYEQTTVTYIDESGNTEAIESTGNHEYYIDGLGWVTAVSSLRLQEPFLVSEVSAKARIGLNCYKRRGGGRSEVKSG